MKPRVALLSLSILSLINVCHGEDLRPATLTWGGYNHNEQLVGAAGQWKFVAKYMDGFDMHGAYWIEHRHTGGPVSAAEVDAALEALGQVLSANHKPACPETGLVENEKDYDPANPAKRAAATSAAKHIAAFKHWATLGVNVGKVRVDWFPMQATAVYAQYFKTASVSALMSMVTGNTDRWGKVNGFDPAIANWREYAHLLNDALPNVRLAFDQAPCNFYRVEPDAGIRARMPWPALGWGYHSDGLKFLYSKQLAMIDGKQVPINVDFADLLMTVAAGTRSQGLNFYAFEGDTPYSYITDNKGRQGKDLLPFLLSIERLLHRNGFAHGKMINDAPPATITDHDQWDRFYHDRSLAFLETWQAAGGRSDEYVAESWHAGPYTLFPETKAGTFSNTARDLIRRLRGIDDDGSRFPLSLNTATTGDTTTVTLTNNGHALNSGDCRCTPLLRARFNPGSAPNITVVTMDGRDVTSSLLASGETDGWFCGGINPGESAQFKLISRGPGAVRLDAYWNPQDPTREPRASVTITSP